MNARPTDSNLPARLSTSAFDDTHPVIYSYLRRRCGSVELAEDLTSATFVTALSGRPDQVWPLPWLITIARNKLIDHWRRQQRGQEIERAEAAASATAIRAEVDQSMSTIESVDLAAALDKISLDHRIAIVLRYLDDLPVAAVANEIGRSVRATESLLVRAKKSLRLVYDIDPSTGQS